MHHEISVFFIILSLLLQHTRKTKFRPVTSGIISTITYDGGSLLIYFFLLPHPSVCTGKHYAISSCLMSLLPVSDLISLSLSFFLDIEWEDKRCRRDKAWWRLHGNGAGEKKKQQKWAPLHMWFIWQNIFTLTFSHLYRKRITNKSVFELITKTTEYLQPNPGMNHRSDIFITLMISLSH